MRHFFTPGRKGGRQLFTDPMTFAKDSMGFRGIVSKVMCGVVNVVIWVGPNPLLHNAFPTSCLRVQRSKAPSGVHITQVTAPAQGSFRCCSKVSGFHKTTLAFGSCWGWITWMFWATLRQPYATTNPEESAKYGQTINQIIRMLICVIEWFYVCTRTDMNGRGMWTSSTSKLQDSQIWSLAHACGQGKQVMKDSRFNETALNISYQYLPTQYVSVDSIP